MNINNSNVIDIGSVLNIINRIKLYIENEEKNIRNIKNILNNLEVFYSGDNSSKIMNKKNNLYNNLDKMLNNRKMYVEYINRAINNYIQLNNQNYLDYMNKDIN